MVFLSGHPAKYWPPSVLCAVCKCVRVYCFVWYSSQRPILIIRQVFTRYHCWHYMSKYPCNATQTIQVPLCQRLIDPRNKSLKNPPEGREPVTSRVTDACISHSATMNRQNKSSHINILLILVHTTHTSQLRVREVMHLKNWKSNWMVFLKLSPTVTYLTHRLRVECSEVAQTSAGLRQAQPTTINIDVGSTNAYDYSSVHTLPGYSLGTVSDEQRYIHDGVEYCTVDKWTAKCFYKLIWDLSLSESDDKPEDSKRWTFKSKNFANKSRKCNGLMRIELIFTSLFTAFLKEFQCFIWRETNSLTNHKMSNIICIDL